MMTAMKVCMCVGYSSWGEGGGGGGVSGCVYVMESICVIASSFPLFSPPLPSRHCGRSTWKQNCLHLLWS